MKSFFDIVPSRNNAFILVFQIRCLKTFLLYIVYQNNSVGRSQIDFPIGCYRTASKREETLAGQSFPKIINLGQINLKTGYVWLLLMLSFILHFWEKWKNKMKRITAQRVMRRPSSQPQLCGHFYLGCSCLFVFFFLPGMEEIKNWTLDQGLSLTTSGAILRSDHLWVSVSLEARQMLCTE